MHVRELMTAGPVCCSPQTSLAEVARLMRDHDCGDIPVVDSADSQRPIGIITDRDIACRVVAEGRGGLDLRAEDCMSSPVISVTPETTVEDCCRTLAEHQIRRVPVVDDAGICCGVVSQADIARRARRALTGGVVREVSRPTDTPSRIG